MKTACGLARLIGRPAQYISALLTLLLCAPAFAGDGGKNVIVPPKAPAAHAVAKRHIYIFTSASAIPQPIDRVAAPIPTTAIPITVINRGGN